MSKRGLCILIVEQKKNESNIEYQTNVSETSIEIDAHKIDTFPKPNGQLISILHYETDKTA